jgi:hypothetical protein
MDPIRDTGNDQLPVALTVLKFIPADFVQWGMKAAACFSILIWMDLLILSR